MSEVAIFTTGIDKPTYGPVIEKINKLGHSAWLYLSDMVVSGEDTMSYRINNEGVFIFSYNNNPIKLENIESAWFRHPQISGINYEDKAKQLSLEREVEALQYPIWAQIPDESWLNSPNRMISAQAKMGQLLLASEVGFSVPETVVSNSWGVINDVFGDDQITIKMPRGVIHEVGQTRVLYATILDSDAKATLQENNPFPAIYQNYLNKKREWRITVVGDDVFQASIYTANSAKDDWRRHQFTKDVEFKAEQMPNEEVDRCINYLGRLGLTYGAFDFIENQDGQITFLECNTNGQYRWLEDILELPISDAIVASLIRKLKC